MGRGATIVLTSTVVAVLAAAAAFVGRTGDAPTDYDGSWSVWVRRGSAVPYAAPAGARVGGRWHRVEAQQIMFTPPAGLRNRVELAVRGETRQRAFVYSACGEETTGPDGATWLRHVLDPWQNSDCIAGGEPLPACAGTWAMSTDGQPPFEVDLLAGGIAAFADGGTGRWGVRDGVLAVAGPALDLGAEFGARAGEFAVALATDGRLTTGGALAPDLGSFVGFRPIDGKHVSGRRVGP